MLLLILVYIDVTGVLDVGACCFFFLLLVVGVDIDVNVAVVGDGG